MAGLRRHRSRPRRASTNDAFLDGLERFASYISTGLISVADLRPYLKYWIDDIAAQTDDPLDAEWTCSFVSYVDYYQF